MRLPDFDKEFIIECNALGTGFSAVLHQDDGVVAFFSKQVAPQHTKLMVYGRELIGLVQVIRH
jgi:hypothetical protein